MAGFYAPTYQGTVTNAGGDSDLGSFSPADDAPIRLHGFLLSQTSEVGDTAEEGLRVTVRRLPATMTVGSGGSSITATKPVNDYAGGSTWGFTARGNDTTVATTNGTGDIVQEVGWNERNSPWDFWFDERFKPVMRQSGSTLTGIVVRMETTPADDLSGCFTFWIEEL